MTEGAEPAAATGRLDVELIAGALARASAAWVPRKGEDGVWRHVPFCAGCGVLPRVGACHPACPVDRARRHVRTFLAAQAAAIEDSPVIPVCPDCGNSAEVHGHREGCPRRRPAVAVSGAREGDEGPPPLSRPRWICRCPGETVRMVTEGRGDCGKPGCPWRQDP